MLLLVSVFSFLISAAPVLPVASAPAVPAIKPELRIAQKDVQEFKKGCIMGASEDVSAVSTQKYCECAGNRLSETVSRDEYIGYSAMTTSSSKGTAPLPEDQFKLVEKKMTNLIKECSALLEAPSGGVVR